MVKIRVRPDTNKCYFDFQYLGQRYREYSALNGTKLNIEKMKKVAKRMDAEIELGTFDFGSHFPMSTNLLRVRLSEKEREKNAENLARIRQGLTDQIPTFREFTKTWFEENEPRWRRSTKRFNTSLLGKHLLPEFGSKLVSDITREDLITFRTKLTKVKSRNGINTLSNRTVNSVMTVLKTVMDEAAYRFQISKVTERIQKLRIAKTKVQPFTLKEVSQIIETIHEDYRDYITVRFFTGMRPSELHALTWEKIDFARREIFVDVTLNVGDMEEDDTKNEFSERVIDMNPLVYEALMRQKAQFGRLSSYVFCNSSGGPVDTKNFQSRIWNVALDTLGLMRRRPYQTRHTAATLWLSSGENPEWIARQMGHSSTQMLFTTYSRWVPNLTRRDGSAFAAMLETNGFVTLNAGDAA